MFGAWVEIHQQPKGMFVGVQAGRSIKLRRGCTFGIASVAKAGSLPNPINVVLYAGTDFHMRALVSSDHAGGVCYDAPRNERPAGLC